MSDLICPACNQPVHRPWGGKVIGALFLDGEDGFYRNTQTFELVCPETKQIVHGMRAETGSNHSEHTVDFSIFLPAVD